MLIVVPWSQTTGEAGRDWFDLNKVNVCYYRVFTFVRHRKELSLRVHFCARESQFNSDFPRRELSVLAQYKSKSVNSAFSGVGSSVFIAMRFKFSVSSAFSIFVVWTIGQNRAVARLSEQARKVSRAPKARASRGVWGQAPRKILTDLLPLKCYFQHFSMRFFFKIQYRVRCKTVDFLVLSTFFTPTIKARDTGTKKMAIPNFALL